MRPTRKLWYLANRISRSAEQIRDARLPSHLGIHKRRLLRHLNELNQVRDWWADHFSPTRRRRPALVSPYLFGCRCDSFSSYPRHWSVQKRGVCR